MFTQVILSTFFISWTIERIYYYYYNHNNHNNRNNHNNTSAILNLNNPILDKKKKLNWFILRQSK